MHQQRHGDPLPGADEHVVLAGRLGGAHGVGQVDQVVGRLAHGADHGHHVGALRGGSGRCGRPRHGSGRRRRPRCPRISGRPVASGRGYRLRTRPDRPPAAGPGTRRARGPRRPGWAIRGHPRGLGRVSGRAQRQESPPARGEGGAPGRRGQAAEAPQADPQRHHRRGDRRRHRRRSSSSSRAATTAASSQSKVGSTTTTHDDRREGRGRQAAGPGQRGGRQGGLPGQHQDRGQHAEVLGGAAP